jgi:DNA primase
VLDRDRVVDAVDLRTLADELLGPRRGAARSATWPCPSPNHAQTGRTPPVSVFRSRTGEERWHCHGCGIGGSAIDLVMAVRGVPMREALEELARRAGLGDRAAPSEPLRCRPAGERPTAAGGVSDPEGLAAYVEECADRLWRPEGRRVLRWLTRARGLPEDVLHLNRIGADTGGARQRRPAGMPSGGWAAVLPAYEAGRPVFAQLRSLSPLPGRPRYLNAAGALAPNPRVALYEPPRAAGPCLLVTEGVLDALSANAAGFRAAAVLGAALAAGGQGGKRAQLVAARLTAYGGRPVIAFDADAAGEWGGRRLQELLSERGVRSGRLHVPEAAGDLNGWMRASRDWKHTLGLAVRMSVAAAREKDGITIG